MSSNYLPPSASIVHIREDGKPIEVDVGTLRIMPGDLMAQDSDGTAIPALQMADQASDTAAQDAFAAVFLGVSREARILAQDGGVNDGSVARIQIDTHGIFQMPCAALGSVAEVGEMVTVACFTNEGTTGFTDPSGALIKDTNHYSYNNKVAITADVSTMIGVVVRRAPVGATSLLVRLEHFLASSAFYD